MFEGSGCRPPSSSDRDAVLFLSQLDERCGDWEGDWPSSVDDVDVHGVAVRTETPCVQPVTDAVAWTLPLSFRLPAHRIVRSRFRLPSIPPPATPSPPPSVPARPPEARPLPSPPLHPFLTIRSFKCSFCFPACFVISVDYSQPNPS